ncbi:MAG: MFS transporter [Roseiflexaceae bacterium]|nr:MFS transporter [Roseiflexaceae bacterium]
MDAQPVAVGVRASGLTESRREQVGWYFYDVANSAFTTTVVTVFLGPYLTNITQAAADATGFVYPLGIPVAADSFFAYMISLSVFLQIFLLPLIGAIADYTNLKKQLLGGFAFAGALITMCLYFVQGNNYLLGGALLVLANLCFGASIVFYNAFLPEIASPERRDAVSSQGWALGYLGGGLLLVANLVLFLNAERFGVSEGQAVRISLVSAGLWWAIFTLVPLRLLRQRGAPRPLPAGERYLTVGFSQLRHTFLQARRFPQTLLFLAAYLLYNDGIQAVIALSSQFGAEELGMESSSLITLILIVQFMAFFGALLFGWLARLLGTKRALIVSLLIWTATVVAAYFVQNGTQFYILAVPIALVLGGSQALSRSVFSQMIPPGQEAEYFSLYEVSERGTSWLAPLFFGLALQFTGSYRIAIISLIVFFFAGLALLSRVDFRRAIVESGNVPPERA